MGVAGAGGCCCNACCKVKDWKFNYPYYMQGTANPWKLDGRPLDPSNYVLADWLRQSAFSVICNVPDGLSDCDLTKLQKFGKIVIATAVKDFTLEESTNIGIRVRFNTNYFIDPAGVNAFVSIKRCKPTGIIDYGFDSYQAGFLAQYNNGYGYGYTTPTDCDSIEVSYSDNIRLTAGPYRINLYVGVDLLSDLEARKSFRLTSSSWQKDTNVTFVFPGLSTENECP